MCVTGNQFSIIEKFHDNGRDWHTLQKGHFAEFFSNYLQFGQGL